MIERMKVLYESGATITKYITDNKTDIIKIRTNTPIGWNNQIIRENKNNANIITLPFIKKIPSDMLLGQDSIKSQRKLLVNGQEKPIVEFTGEYRDDVYYMSTQ